MIYQTPTLNTKHGNNINPHLEITISRSDKTSPNEILNKSLNDSPMILISPSPAKNIQKKDSIIEIGFQNNIFDYQNLNSPNITNHEYGDIFNEDDYNSPEIKGKYPEIEQKFPKKTLGSRK